MKISVIGTGSIGRRHIGNFLSIGAAVTAFDADQAARERARGMHPAVLSRGGLRPAIRALARRSTVPVELSVEVDHRLPESVEVAAYYVVAEALTNVAKHANADSVTVEIGLHDGLLQLSVTDDGVGGATAGGGSGLVGLRDRVDALSGELSVTSTTGAGTLVRASIPVGDR